VPGDAVRDAFSDFMWSHEHFHRWVEGVADGSYSSPDLPQNYFLTEFAAKNNITGDALDELLLFYLAYSTLDTAADLSAIGMANDVWRQYKQDKEWMVAEPTGYVKLAHWLSRGLDVRLNSVAQSIEYDSDGVKVHLRDGSVVEGAVALVTVPLGVLQAGSLRFDPPLPPWKIKAIMGGAMGLLDKIYLRWESAWWPSQVDAFWRVHGEELFSKSTANEWYNIHNLKVEVNGTVIQPPAVLLATPAGYHARLLESLSDDKVITGLVEELRQIFPELTIPRPVEMLRTKWHQDEFAKGSYAAPPVGMDPLTAAYLAQPLADRIFFAGEATSTDRFGYVDGAYETGLREAIRIADRCAGSCPPPMQPVNATAFKPDNDASLRTAWYDLVKKYVL